MARPPLLPCFDRRVIRTWEGPSSASMAKETLLSAARVFGLRVAEEGGELLKADVPAADSGGEVFFLGLERPEMAPETLLASRLARDLNSQDKWLREKNATEGCTNLWDTLKPIH